MTCRFKKCYKCGTQKSVPHFSKRKREKDGLQSECKECVKEYNKQWRLKNANYHKEYYKITKFL